MAYTVLVTTSGIGSRLGELTKFTNKSLVRVGSKPVIAHIIESYPADTHFVVTLGYFGDHVRDFLMLAYPERDFEFVTVDRYEGEGTSLGFSMLQASAVLDRPFIYHACDTLVEGTIPSPDSNWIGVFRGSDTAQYASWTQQEGNLEFHEKGAIVADYLHIGLVGIHDHESFWRNLKTLYEADPLNSSLNDCQTIARMIKEGVTMTPHVFETWHDVGNVASLQEARRAKGSSLDDLDKVDESVFIFPTYVIKFFSNKELTRRRVERARLLQGFVPRLEGERGNFYRYAYVEGDLYSHVVQPQDFKKFLDWMQKSFWKDEKVLEDVAFDALCKDFYYDKTLKRVNTFLTAHGMQDMEHVINGEKVPAIKTLLKEIDFNWLSHGKQSRFHGDCILENVIRTPEGYSLIDWRQDFAGETRVGDRYYDLAKLNHNLTINHRIVNQGHITVRSDAAGVWCDILRPQVLVECQDEFFAFLDEHSYDRRKVEVLSAIIWLNMAPLHHHPFDLFLYYFGKLQLWRALKRHT